VVAPQNLPKPINLRTVVRSLSEGQMKAALQGSMGLSPTLKRPQASRRASERPKVAHQTSTTQTINLNLAEAEDPNGRMSLAEVSHHWTRRAPCLRASQVNLILEASLLKTLHLLRYPNRLTIHQLLEELPIKLAHRQTALD